MNEQDQSDVLKLAERLDATVLFPSGNDRCQRAATALRELHAENLQLKSALAQREAQAQQVNQQMAQAIRTELLNTPELHQFTEGVTLEASHQRERWGSTHDAGKTPADWFWLVGYLAGKALHAQAAGNIEKALHHTISTAAALANWHAAISGTNTLMRPGINPAEHGIDAEIATAEKVKSDSVPSPIIVCWVTKVGTERTDLYQVFLPDEGENYQLKAKEFYEHLLKMSTTYSANLCVVKESTDYAVGGGL